MELMEWRAYERLEPFGDRVAQRMIAQLTATVASALSGKEVKLDDLMPCWREEAEEGGSGEMDWRKMKRAMQAIE